MDQKPDFKRPKASSIGTPVYHRKRRDWKDDRNLLEDVASAVCLMNGPYDYYEAGTVSFRNKIKKFREKGYEVNKDACHLAMWVREQLSELSHKLGNYDLRVHPIPLPQNIDDGIRSVEKKATKSGLVASSFDLSLAELFPDIKLRNFARERMQVLHRGDLKSYLASLVNKERDALATNSASIMDLIHICEHKLDLREIEYVKRYAVGETDLWVPQWTLGIEVRNTWSDKEEEDLTNTLSTTNFRLKARHLVVVVPDDLSDESFEMIRGIERRKVYSNLSILRVGDLGKYFDRIKEIEEGRI